MRDAVDTMSLLDYENEMAVKTEEVKVMEIIGEPYKYGNPELGGYIIDIKVKARGNRKFVEKFWARDMDTLMQIKVGDYILVKSEE